MDQIKIDQEALDDKVREQKLQKTEFYKKAGEFYFGTAALAEEDFECTSLRDNIKDIDDEVAKTQILVKEIDEMSAELEQLDDGQKEKRQGIKDLSKDNLVHFESIGRAAFQAYRENEFSASNIEEIFAPLVELKDKINTYEVQLKGSPQSEGSFIDKIARRGKEVFLKSNQSVGIRNMTKAYQKAGEELVKVEGLDYQGVETLTQAFAPYMQTRQGFEALEAAMGKSQARVDEVSNALKERDSLRNPKKKIQDLDKSLENLGRQRADIIVSLGGACYSHGSGKKSLPEELAVIGSQIDKVDGELKVEEDRLIRVRRRESLNVELIRQENERDHIENSIDRYKQDLKERKKSIAEIQAELITLEEG